MTRHIPIFYHQSHAYMWFWLWSLPFSRTYAYATDHIPQIIDKRVPWFLCISCKSNSPTWYHHWKHDTETWYIPENWRKTTAHSGVLYNQSDFTCEPKSVPNNSRLDKSVWKAITAPTNNSKNAAADDEKTKCKNYAEGPGRQMKRTKFRSG